MTRHQTVLFRQLLLGIDVAIIAVAFFVALYLRQWLPLLVPILPDMFTDMLDPGGVVDVDEYNKVLLGMLPLWALSLFHSRTQDFRSSYGRLSLRYLQAVAIGLGLLVVAQFFFKLEFLSRAFVFIFGVLQFVTLLLSRILVMEGIKRTKRVDDHRVLVVGCGGRAVNFAKILRERGPWNNRLLGHVAVAGEVPDERATPVLGRVDELAKILDSDVVDEVVFAVPGRSPEEFEGALRDCDTRGVDVLLTMPPSLPEDGRLEIANVTGFNMPLIGLSRTPTAQGGLALKRLIDILGASIAIALAAPIMLLTVIAIKLDSPGPVLFKQVRSGRNGRRFVMLKFRSMVADAEKRREELLHLNEMGGPVFKIKTDPRITRVGRFIRKTSIDELPQLFNVFVGHMSLVGPRPPLPSEVSQYEPWQRRRLSVRPGITGMWQVSGRNEIDFEQWMKLDLKYIDNWSLWLDLKILFQTVPVVLLHKGAS